MSNERRTSEIPRTFISIVNKNWFPINAYSNPEIEYVELCERMSLEAHAQNPYRTTGGPSARHPQEVVWNILRANQNMVRRNPDLVRHLDLPTTSIPTTSGRYRLMKVPIDVLAAAIQHDDFEDNQNVRSLEKKLKALDAESDDARRVRLKLQRTRGELFQQRRDRTDKLIRGVKRSKDRQFLRELDYRAQVTLEQLTRSTEARRYVDEMYYFFRVGNNSMDALTRVIVKACGDAPTNIRDRKQLHPSEIEQIKRFMQVHPNFAERYGEFTDSARDLTVGELVYSAAKRVIVINALNRFIAHDAINVLFTDEHFRTEYWKRRGKQKGYNNGHQQEVYLAHLVAAGKHRLIQETRAMIERDILTPIKRYVDTLPANHPQRKKYEDVTSAVGKRMKDNYYDRVTDEGPLYVWTSKPQLMSRHGLKPKQIDIRPFTPYEISDELFEDVIEAAVGFHTVLAEYFGSYSKRGLVKPLFTVTNLNWKVHQNGN